MKKLSLLGLLVLLAVKASMARDADFNLAIAIPDGSMALRLVAYDPAGKAPFYVLLTNRSGRTQHLWEEWNSWGYYNLSFEVTDATGRTWTVAKGPRDWTRNWHTWFSIDPDETHVFSVNFPGEWMDLPKLDHPTPFTIRAIYQIHPDPETGNKLLDTKSDHVWTGRIVSKPVEIQMYFQK